MKSDTPGVVARFDRDFFDPERRYQSIGAGALGGKAAGLATAHRILSSAPEARSFRRMEVSIPSLTVLRTEVFRDFVSRNQLEQKVAPDDPDEAIARAFQRGDLPPAFVGDLRGLIEKVRTPLAIRSSSRLEDDLSRPFAGVYRTKMIPNNQPSADDRFRRLVEAIKLVWASTWFAEARAYIASGGHPPQPDEMAVIIQEVVGSRFRERFYPQVSGVARSYSYYRAGHARPEDGVASLALGLGKTIVDGGVCWTYSPAWPAAPAPFASPAAMVKGTQSEFWAVNLGKPPAYDPLRETEYLVRSTLADAEDDGTLNRIASTWDAESNRIRMGIGTKGPRVLDFAMLLTLPDIPVNDVIRALLPLFEKELGAPVEIEFAVTFDPNRFGFLQVRPMLVSHETVTVSDAEMSGAVVSSEFVLGNGSIGGIRDIVYVRPESPAMETPAMAADIAVFNAELVRLGRPYIIIGLGRWGSSDPSLGIPVVWSQIAGARVIVEVMTEEMNVEMSQGSHFFHNLSSFRVPYFSVPLGRRGAIDWAWLERQRVVRDLGHVRHVQSEQPVEVRVDGRSGRGVIVDSEERA